MRDDVGMIMERSGRATWEEDDEADVLSVSLREPRVAVGVDVGDGCRIRYDEAGRKLGRLTLIGTGARLRRELAAG